MDLVGYRDREGKPIGALEWARLWEDFEYRRIDETPLPQGGRVVTVWSGMISPVVEGLFFTAVFSANRRTVVEEIPTQTEADARAMHAATVARLVTP